jgi:NADH dehydrogenase
VLPTLSEKVSKKAERRLRMMGVNIFTNRVLQSQDIEEITTADMSMDSHTVIWTAGTRISTSFDTIPNAALTDRKRIVVSPELALPTDNHVFIAGDGAGTQYSGLAQTAIHNGAYIGETIAAMISCKKIAAYVPKRPSFVIPIGNYWAIFNYKNFVITGFFAWLLRSAIDFRYFTSIVPMSYVFKVFKQGRKYRKVKGGCDIQ